MNNLADWASLARAIDQPNDASLKPLLAARHNQLAGSGGPLSDLAIITIVEEGDSLDALEAQVGFPIATNLIDGSRLGEPEFMPSWEYAERHSSGWTEMVFVFSDDGCAHVILVPDADQIDPALRQLCQVADRHDGSTGQEIAQ